MNVIKLRDQLKTVLGSELGTYTTKTGKTYPAIWITPPLVDASYTITGLQVIIFKSPEVQKQIALTSEKLKKRWWVIELVQNDVNQSIQPAVELIENFFPIVVSRIKPQTRTEFEQARLSIYDPIFTGVSGSLN